MIKLLLRALALLALAVPALAQEFPVRAVRIIVPYAPGNGADLITRMIASELGNIWGQQVIVDNRPGGSGILAVNELMKAPADGYHYLMGDVGNLAINPSLYRKLPYNPDQDLEPITDIMHAPWVLFVSKDSPYQTLGDLIAAAKAHPGKLTYSSTGAGAPNFMAAELLKLRTGINLLHVPFKDGNQARTATINGDITLIISAWVSAKSVIDRLRPLAVAAATRQPTYSQVPTVAEAGGPKDYYVSAWASFMGKAGMPNEIRDKMFHDTVKAMEAPAVKKRITNVGFDIGGRTPAELITFIKSERARYKEVIEAAKVELRN